jgi:predicted ATPase
MRNSLYYTYTNSIIRACVAVLKHTISMLTHLQIRNFKAWRNTQTIRLAPLTVFFGSNSSGKSSINQLLLMLKQTVQSSDRRMALHFGDKKTVIELGTFWDVVYAHNNQEKIAFEIEWQLPREMKVKDVRSNQHYFGNTIKFSTEIGLPGGERQDLVVYQMSYQLGEPSKGLKVEMTRNSPDPNKDNYLLTASPSNLVAKQSTSLSHPIHFYGFPYEVTAQYDNAEFAHEFTLALEKRLQDIYYLGALREPPQRYYIKSGENPESVGWRGERAVDVILAAQHKLIKTASKTLPFEAMIADWLKKMGLIDTFEVKQIAPNRRDYEVLVKNVGVKDKVNLTDVGFGVSQVLPVLVQCFYAAHGTTTILEQPEVHLHPSAQAVLADLFIDAIAATDEREKPHNIQLLIESHSEHFLRRLQRRIAEQKIRPIDTAIYFCEMTSAGSMLNRLEIDDYKDCI